MLRSVGSKNVKVTGGVFRERMSLNRNYLAELDTDALLQNFHIEAGIPFKNQQTIYDPVTSGLHWGWESPTCQLRGHFLGHWMSAAARIVSGKGNSDRELEYKLAVVVDELERCQKRNGGEWTGPIPEKFFEIMAGDEYIWSPQYTMHKTFMGLTDTYIFTGNRKALDIADRLADWYIRWAERMKDINPFAVYKGEQAGMLEIWAKLFEITKKEKYLTLIDLYKENGLFHQLEAGKDALSDDHANASIPLSHGAAKLYELTGEKRWNDIVKLFWKNAVTDRGMFATTGANAGEFWLPPFSQAEYLCDRDQEFCTVYNMVRTAEYLYRESSDTHYQDYIERALYNGFLAQQNPSTGMPAYFLPLNEGAKKKWGSKTSDFWCCHGTMVQAQTLYPELIYYTDDSDGLYVMQYIPSEADVNICGNNITVSQATEMKNYNNQVFFDEQGGGEKSRWSIKFRIKCNSSEKVHFTLMLRVPEWAEDNPVLMTDEKETVPEIVNGCIRIEKDWTDNTVYIRFASHITMERLPDRPELAAAVDGPIVLAGLSQADCGLRGDYSVPESIFAARSEHTYSTYVWKQNHYITKNQAVNLSFVPLYEVADEAYTVYFTEKNGD